MAAVRAPVTCGVDSTGLAAAAACSVPRRHSICQRLWLGIVWTARPVQRRQQQHVAVVGCPRQQQHAAMQAVAAAAVRRMPGLLSIVQPPMSLLQLIHSCLWLSLLQERLHLGRVFGHHCSVIACQIICKTVFSLQLIDLGDGTLPNQQVLLLSGMQAAGCAGAVSCFSCCCLKQEHPAFVKHGWGLLFA